MEIRTDIATHYYWRQIITAVICVVLSAWGAYDLFIKIPHDEAAYATYVEDRDRLDALQTRVDDGRMLTSDEREEYEELSTRLEGVELEPPTAFDKFVQWMFIACILWVPWSYYAIARIKRNPYVLDDDGNLTIHGDTTWARDEIADIDLSRWMEKSIAWVKHTDGTTHKLDAYLYKDLDLIIGRLAHRFYPEKWTEDAKPVKNVDTAEDDDLEWDEEIAKGDDTLGTESNDPSDPPEKSHS